MELVFTADTLLEAHLIKQMLDSESIPAYVFNEYANGAMGEIPLTSVWPEVWIEYDNCRLRALNIISRYRGSHDFESDRLCHRCQVQNPENFELCWQCGSSFNYYD